MISNAFGSFLFGVLVGAPTGAIAVVLLILSLGADPMHSVIVLTLPWRGEIVEHTEHGPDVDPTTDGRCIKDWGCVKVKIRARFGVIPAADIEIMDPSLFVCVVPESVAA